MQSAGSLEASGYTKSREEYSADFVTQLGETKKRAPMEKGLVNSGFEEEVGGQPVSKTRNPHRSC
jgi:hypothetical protein